MTLLSTSRPASSVPSTCFADGASRTISRSTAYGSCVAKNGAKIATRTSNAITAEPMTASRWRTNARRTPNCRRAGAASTSAGACCADWCVTAGLEIARVSLPIADPRVSVCIQDVGEQVAQQDQRGRHQDDAHQEWIVPPVDGPYRQPAHARPLEDLLGDDGSAEQIGQTQADHRDQRDQGVAQRVANHHDEFVQP